MTVYDIRPARPSEINGILDFQRAAVAGVPARFYPAPAKEAWLRTPVPGLNALIAAGRYYVAANDDRIVAGAGWEPHATEADAATLRGVFVHPDCKGSGLGARLVNVAEDAAVSMGFARLFVPAALNATGFYERLGYRGQDKAEIALNGSRIVYCKMWKDVA